jgi:hypothetical protein
LSLIEVAMKAPRKGDCFLSRGEPKREEESNRCWRNPLKTFDWRKDKVWILFPLALDFLHKDLDFPSKDFENPS